MFLQRVACSVKHTELSPNSAVALRSKTLYSRNLFTVEESSKTHRMLPGHEPYSQAPTNSMQHLADKEPDITYCENRT